MKLVLVDDFRLGVLGEHGIHDASSVAADVPHTGPHDLMNRLIAEFDRFRPALEKVKTNGQAVPFDSVRLRPPLPAPNNIVGMALNYIDSASGPRRGPIEAFLKSAGSIIGPEDTMVLPDFPASAFEGEAEFAAVIGRRASNVSEASAMDYVFGYVNFIDGSVRGASSHYQMKARETFSPIGPYLVTADEVRDPHDLQIRLWVNGELRQDFSSSGMAHRLPSCIAWASSIHTLEPGDILATGTSHDGLSAFQDGDEVELETDGLGRLRIHIRDDLKRTWSRDTYLQRKEKNQSADVVRQLTGKYGPTEAGQ